MIVFLWLILFCLFAGSYLIYFGYMKLHANKQWGFKIDPDFSPNVTILVPAHNEERVIQSKLENLAKLSYPKEKMEIILIDDASTDQTLAKAHSYIENHPELPVKILKQNPRKGKANALNMGLEVASNEYIVVTDADSLCPSDILSKALPYMSNPNIGAITGHGLISSTNESWVKRAEENYLSLINLLRLGESKIHSTIRFEGCFCVFFKEAFDKFDSESGADDSGTALRVIQNGYRAILVPEVYAFIEVTNKFKNRIRVKMRRAIHLNGLWFHCLKLIFKRRLMLPKRIAVPEIFISIFNPIIFLSLVPITLNLVISYPIILMPMALGFGVLGLIPKMRSYLVEGVLNQFILLCSIVFYASKRKIVSWDN